MRFGFHLPNFGPEANPETIVTVAQKAEALGFDSVWVVDHLIMPEVHVDKFSAAVYEPLTVLSFVAAATKKIKLGTSVIILPYRHPMEVAKIVSTLDVLSGGRVIFGAAAGWMEEEFDVLGVPFKERGSRSDEYLKLMKELWTSERPNFHGRYYQVANIRFEPKPVQRPHPPIWVGGASQPAIRRAVDLGDGWHPVGLSPEQLRAGLEYLRAYAREKGRDPATIEISVRLRLSFTEDAVARERNGLVGSADEIVARIKEYERLGVSTVLLDASFSFLPKDALLALMERIAREILTH
jgi:probable F420-dependent oxidoreductase